MGEIAEMILDGILCDACGSYFEDGEEPGHPRKCKECTREEKPKQQKGAARSERSKNGIRKHKHGFSAADGLQKERQAND